MFNKCYKDNDFILKNLKKKKLENIKSSTQIYKTSLI